MKNRIDEMFDRARAERRAALILYITAGFPDADTTRRLLPVLAESGCDLIELGAPFSDPIADGPTIQQASTKALEAGMTLPKAFDILRGFRGAHDTPVVVFGAFNPFLARGLEATARMAKEAGADGFLAADVPVEEAEEFGAICRAQGLHLVLLAAPTSPPERLERIGALTGGFLYCISMKGITGGSGGIDAGIGAYIERLRAATAAPLAVGFGISTPEHASALAPQADAIVVGSALIRLIEKVSSEGGDLEGEVARFVRDLADACRR